MQITVLIIALLSAITPIVTDPMKQDSTTPNVESTDLSNPDGGGRLGDDPLMR